MSGTHRLVERVRDISEARRNYFESRHKAFRARPWRLLSGFVSWVQYLQATGRTSLGILTVVGGVALAGATVYLQVVGYAKLSVGSFAALVVAVLPCLAELRRLRAEKRSVRLVPTHHPLSAGTLDLGPGVRGVHVVRVFRRAADPPPVVTRRARRRSRWQRLLPPSTPTPPPPAQGPTTEESVYCTYPDVNSALLSSPGGRGPRVFFGEGRQEVHPRVEKYRSSILLFKYDNRVRPFNGQTVSQSRDIDPEFRSNDAEVDFLPSRYFQLLYGDYLVSQRLESNGDVEIDGADLVSTPGPGGGRRLLPLQETRSSNSVGVSTIAFDSGGKLILILQGENAFSSAGLLAPSGSGSLEPRDFDSALEYLEQHPPPTGTPGVVRLADLVVEGMERELLEESNIRGKWILESHLTGYFRWLSKGGKPEYCGVTRLRQPVETLTRRLSEHRWVRQIVVGVEVDHRALKADPGDPAAALRIPEAQRLALKIEALGGPAANEAGFDPLSHRISTPLQVCLELYGRYLNAHQIDPDTWFTP